MKNLTPLQAIRSHCRWCCLEQSYEIRMCQSMNSCPVWLFRLGRLPEHGSRSALKAIRGRCLDCVGGSVKDVKECKTECALSPYRFGKRVNVSEAYRGQARAWAKLNPAFQKRRTDKPIQESNAVGRPCCLCPQIDSGRVLPGVAGSCRSIPDPA